MKYFVHESSYIDEDVEIGDGTKVWHFSHVHSGVQIGKNCSLGQNVINDSLQAKLKEEMIPSMVYYMILKHKQ